jgi:nitrite reductase/ring-hydroxylating ferredoxin subunit
MDVKVPLIDDATVAEGASAEVDFFGRPVVVVRKDGLTRAYANVCPHLGGPLKLSADGETFVCQWHGACFDARTGKTLCGPARPDARLMRLPTKVENGALTYAYGETDASTEAAG